VLHHSGWERDLHAEVDSVERSYNGVVQGKVALARPETPARFSTTRAAVPAWYICADGTKNLLNGYAPSYRDCWSSVRTNSAGFPYPH
jgi:hypothetical protein